MQGLMQYHPLMISSVIEFAATYHGDTEVVSRRVEGDIHRSNYATINRRAKQIANALDAMGLAQSARVGTLAWNGYRHFELYYGVSGSGRVLHTLNPRLHPEQLAWIINHAEDEALCFDMTFLPLVKAVAAKLPTVKRFIALCDADKLPADSGIPNLQSYETWIGAHSDQYVWPAFDENLASSLCYTSGTTGNPKGVLYSHRSTMLHAMAGAATDVIGICSRDTVLPVVPMFSALIVSLVSGTASGGGGADKLLGMGDRIEVWSAKAYADMRREKVDLTSLAEDVMGSLGNDDGK